MSNFFDAVYVINLANSTDRWNKISSKLNQTNISYLRFEAVDGYSVTLTDLKSGVKFKGRDIKDKRVYIQNYTSYDVLCDNGIQESKEVRINSGKISLIAGQFGIWCSMILLRNEIVKKNFSNTLIFEDDFDPKVENFTVGLQNFFNNLPSDYDIAYLGARIISGETIALQGNTYFSKFAPKSKWYGT